MFWKVYSGAELIGTTKKDLRLLKKRNELLHRDGPNHDGSLLLMCVDNCCIVRPKTQAITGPDTLVKLDAFHWQW